jgi:Ser/Thr protein kinase RdoA (MazF antagonist)
MRIIFSEVKMISDDFKKDTALEIINEILNTRPDVITRFTNGYCHSVYYVETKDKKYVLRITGKENEEFYRGSIKWLPKLAVLGIPVPEIIKHGQYSEVFFNLMKFIEGRDLGEVYYTLTDPQKHCIAKDLTAIQAKASKLPPAGLFGYNSFSTWRSFLESLINRSLLRIRQNKIFDENVCDKVASVMSGLNDYFSDIKPVPFLDDITTKNVLVNNGKLSGIVDVDEICYGDSLLVVGLTNMALLSMRADTKYVDYWLDEIDVNDSQRKAVKFYTLLYCVDFMGEQGMRFGNDKNIPANQEVIDLLNATYSKLISGNYSI